MLDQRAECESILTIRVLGEPSVRFAGENVRIVNRKLLCLLAYLAMVDGCRESRERLVGLLWSESDEKHARGSLRQAMTAFRRISGELGFDGFETDRGHVALAPNQIRVDVTQVLARLGPDEVHPLLLEVEDLPSTLLQGCEDIDPSFRNWLNVQREILRDRIVRALTDQLDVPGARGRDVAQALLRIDQTQELAARKLMENLAGSGDVAGALAVYNALWRVLDEEHDMEPTEPTQELVARIKSGRFPTASERPPAAAPAVPRHPPLLIVGQFNLRGGAGGAEVMLDGFRHALIAALVRFREWHVAEEEPGAALPSETGPAARDRYRIRATAEPLEGGLRVTLTFRREDSGIFLWSDSFDLTYGNWSEAQGALLRNVTIALNVNLSAERLRQASGGGALNDSLHDLWLEGQRLILEFNAASWSEAERLLRQVAEAQPHFAPAYSSLVQLGNTSHIARPGVTRSAALHQETLHLAQKAVTLDPLDSRAQLALGWALAFVDRWEQAEMTFGLALQLNSHDPWTMTSVAQALAVAGRHEAATSLAEAALAAAPLPNHTRWGYHASIRFFGGDDEGALEAARIAGDTHASNGAWRAAALAHLGRSEEARTEAAALVKHLSARWAAAEPASPRTVARWVLQMFPYRREQEWRRLRAGLRGAGLPVAHAPFRDVGP